MSDLCSACAAGCFSEGGEGWLWGFGTSNQLGKGDDDEGAPSFVTAVALLLSNFATSLMLHIFQQATLTLR